MTALVVTVSPEQRVSVRLSVQSASDEARLADDLRARRHRLLAELEETIDDAITLLEQRAQRYRWTRAEIEGRRAA